MTCEVCRCLAGEGQCGECRALAREMNANAEALGEMRYDELPPVALKIPRRRSKYPWLATAAAVVTLGIVLPQVWHHRPQPTVEAPTETLTIKMLTPDPTVVIYWLTDIKEEKR